MNLATEPPPQHRDAPHPELARARQRGETLEREIVELCAHLNAASYRFLMLIAEFDRDQHWAGYGCASCAHWLNWQCGLGGTAAREHVRVARALEALPQIAAAFSRGEVSYSKVREMTRIATAENEDTLLNVARHGTATHVERLVRRYRRFERGEEASNAEALHRQRHVHYRCYEEDGSVVIHAKLPPEVGALVMKAIDAAVEELYRDGMRGGEAGQAQDPEGRDDPSVHSAEASAEGKDCETAPAEIDLEARPVETESNVPAGTAAEDLPEVSPPLWMPDRSVPGRSVVEELAGQSWCDSLGRRRADALRLLAERFLATAPVASGSAAERYQVVVHVDQAWLARPARGAPAETVSSDGPPRGERCELEDGQRLAVETARRLGCDSSLVGVLDDENGEPLNVGRKTRSLSPALARALRARDGGRGVRVLRGRRRADRGERAQAPAGDYRLCRAHAIGGFSGGARERPEPGRTEPARRARHRRAHRALPVARRADGLRLGGPLPGPLQRSCEAAGGVCDGPAAVNSVNVAQRGNERRHDEHIRLRNLRYQVRTACA